MLRSWTLPLVLLLFSTYSSRTVQTSQPAGTDIFLAELTERAGQLQVGAPLNITRRSGYDNQPMFMPDGTRLLYTSIREDKQADIYRYDLDTKSSYRFTVTRESEYSPTVMPDHKSCSVVRVEADGTQRLWKFLIAGGSPALVLENIKPVGYHVWLDPKTLVLFVLGSPNTLQWVDVPTQKAEIITTNVGRSLQLVPSSQGVSFVHKVTQDEWTIKTLDAKSRAVTPIVKTLPGSEDHAWTRGGTLIMAQGSKLFKYAPGRDRDWVALVDFSSQGIKGITRLAVSPAGDRVAFVAADVP
jgi:hypothetical protein